MAQKKKSSWSSRFKRVSEGAEREYSAPLSKPVETPKGHTLKPGEALNISIPRGYFEAREAEKQAAAKKNQSSSARWTSRELEALAQSNTKRAEQLAETAYASNDDSRLDELKKVREQAAKFSTAADKKKAEEKAEADAKKATEYADYAKKFNFETKAAEGAKKAGNKVQYVKDNWVKLAAGSPAAKGTKLVYRHLTDDEVKTYNYILAVKGEKEAQEYLDIMEDTLNQREGSAQFEHLKTLGDADYEIKTPQYGNNHKYLTDKEARTYEYIASTVGQEQADKYLKDKEPELQQRKMRGEVFTPQIDKFGEKLATGVHGLMAGGDQWSQGVKQTFSNDLLSPTGTQYAQGQVLEQLQKQSLGNQYVTDEELAQKPNFGGMGYQAAVTVGNMLPMILASQFLGGGAGLAGWADDIAKIAQSKKTIEKFTKMAGAFGKASKVAGSGVMYMGANGNAYNQARKEGYTEGQARLYGLLVGASETALQGLLGGITPLKFTPDEIEKRILSLDRVWKRALGLLGYNVLSETAEEEIQLFLEPAFATMMTNKDYESPTFQEAIATALITFLSTGALEGIPSIMRANSPEARLISAEAAIQAAMKKYEAAKKAVDASDTDANSTVSPAASEEAKQADVSSEAVAASNPGRTVVDAATTLLMEKQGLDLKTATKRAEIIQKLVDGVDMKPADFIKMVNRLDPKNPTTQAIFTELTGVVFPENKGSVEVMYNTYRSAHEVAQQQVKVNQINAEAASLNVEAPVDEAAIPAEAQALHPGVPAIEDVQPGVTEFINEVNNNVGEEGQALRGFASFKEEMSKRDPNLVRGSDEMWERLYRQYLGDNETLEFRGQRFTHREFMSLDLRDEKGKVLSAEEKEARWAAEREFQQEKARKRERGLQLRLTEQQRYATVKWEKALKSYGVEVIWDDTMGRAPGSSDQRGAIYLNPRRLTTETAIAEIVAHELVHSIENVEVKAAMVEDIIETLHPKNKSLDEELDKEIKKYQRYYDEHGIDFTVTPEWIREEYAGDLMRATFTDETLRAKLAGEKPSIMRKILNVIDKFLDFVGDTDQRKEVSKIRERFAKALATNADATYRKPGDIYNEDGKLVVSSNDQGYSRLSLSTYEMEGREYLVNWMDTAVDKGDLTREDADAIIDSLDQIYDTCMEYKEKYGPFSEWSDAKVVTDANGNPVFSVVKPNGDYAMNLDFSLVCKKRRTLDAVLNELVKRGVADDLRMGQKDFVKINNIIRTYGFETACDLCFVDAKRFRQAEVADNFVKMYNDLVKSLAPKGSGITFDYFNFGGNTLVQNTGTGIDTVSDADLDFTQIDHVLETQKPDSGAGSVEYRIAKHLKATAADRKLLLRGDFISTAGFNTVNVTNPAVLKLFNAKKGSAGPKSAVSDVQYLNEILRSSTFNRDKAYRVGGVRVQSFSDYVPRMVFDYLQMFADLAAKKLPAHTYTKEELFVKQFGLTGIKINMSLIPRVVNNGVAAGLDADGNYAWAKESFDYNTAVDIQNAEGYRRNCGTIAVGVSDEHIRKMMADPEIRMIIPYHKSGLNPVVAKLNNIQTYTDYTLEQNTRRASTGKKLDPKVAADKKLLDAMPDFNTLLFEAGENGDPRAAVETYVRWCEENDLLPKFDKFCYKQIDGVFVEENGKKVIDENYYKLIEDFTVYDNGQYVPQQDITMTFPDENSAFGSMKDLIKRGLEEDAILEGDRKEKVPAIADEIETALGKKTKAPQKRMAIGGEFTADFTQQEKRMSAIQMLLHGKSNAEIRKETGWWQGKDGKWRFEFDDSTAKLKQITGSGTLDEFLDHPELFRNYPGLKNVHVYVDHELGNEGARTYGMDIHISPKLKGLYFKQTLLHEIQHIIQTQEGREIGSNLDVAYRQLFVDAYNRIKYTPDFNRLKTYTERVRAVENEIVGQKTSGKLIDDSQKLYDLVYDQYHDSIGEQEARDTAARANMTPEQRKANAPYMADRGVSTKNYRAEQEAFRQAHKELGQLGNAKIEAPVYNNVRGILYGPTTRGVNSLTKQDLKNPDTRYALETDEAGLELTPAQSKYFEKSKARDRLGNLMRFFHTTDDFGFTIFDPEASGDVLFFANSLPISRTYSSHKEAPLRPMIKGMDLSRFEELDRLLDADQAWEYLSKVSYENKSDAPATREELEAAWQESIDQFMDTYENTFNELKEIAERFSVNSVIALLNDAQEDFDRARTGEDVYDRLGDLQNALRSMSAAKSEFFNDAQMWYDVDNESYDEFISTIEMYDDWYTVVEHHANALEALDSGKDIYKVEYMFGLYGDVFLSDEMAVETALATNEEMRSGVYAAYLNVEKPLVIDCHGLNWNELDFEDLVDMDPYASWPKEGWAGSTTREVAAWAKEHGYDGVIFENLTDVGGMSPLRSDNNETTIVAVFQSEQVKSVFNKEPTKHPDIRYALDSDYMAAVESGDMETAQKMVDEAAEAAFSESEVRNYNSKKLFKVYHATGAQFTVFDKKRFGASNGSAFGEGFYFTDDEWLAKSYGQKLGSYYLNIKNPFWYDSWQPEDLASMLERSGYEFDREYLMERADSVAFLESDLLDYVLPVIVKGGKFTSRELSQMLRDAGYDGVFAGEEFIAFEPEQIKSADPVTYDDAGNVIPLSERFNPKNPDIRYALSDDVKKEYSEKYGVENPSEKELMRHIERLEQEKLDVELERAAAETLRKLREEDQLAFKQKLSDQKMLDEMYYRRIGGKQLQKAEQKLDDAKARRARDIEDLNDKNLGTEMGYKREMREQKRDMKAKADARVQAERQKRLDAIALQRTIAKAEKAAQHQRDEMVLGRRIAELQRKAATNLKVTTDAYRDRMSKLREKSKERTENLKQYYKLRSNAAKAVLRDKAKADAKRAEIEKEQGLVDTLRKAPAQRSFYEKKQDAISKLKSALRTAQFELENMANEIDRFAKRQVSPVTAGDLVTLLGGTTSTVEQIFKTALLDRTGNRLKVNGKELGSMKDVFLCLDSKGKVQENMQALLQDYMLHMHNQDRMSFVARAEAALTKFEEEHPYIASLTSDSLALLVTQTDKQTEELNNEPMVTAAREYAALLKERVKAKDKAVFGDDKGNDVTAEFSKQRCEEILAQAPWVAEKAEGIYEWWDAFMRAWAVGDSLSLEQYEHMRELYPHYVPTYRKDHGGIGSPNYVGATSAKPGEATRAAKGSHAEIVNIEDTFTTMVAKIVKLARTNELYKNILDTAMLDDNGTFADMISFNWDWQTGDYGKALEEGAFFNGDLDHHIDTNVGTEVTKEPIPNSNKFKYTLYAWYNGTKFSAEISPELYRSIAAVSGQLDNEWFKAAVAAGNFLTSPMKTFITGKNPAFALRNTMRDFSTAMVNTRVVNSVSGLAYPQYWARAVDEMRKHSDHWNNFVALGGTHGTQYRDAVTPSKALYKEKNWAGQAWDAVGKFNEVTESVTRFAEYLATVDRLGDTYENRIKGIKNAAEITVDFSRKGRTGKLINAWVPYWNPAVQGISKQIRSLVESPDGSAIMKQALKIGGRVVAQQVLLEGVLRAILKFKDRDDEWEKLDDRTKDAYYCIPLKDEHKFLKIPKSREWSAILGNNLWRILESANGRADAWDNYVETSLEASYLPPAIFRIDRETGGYETDFFPLSLFNDLMTNKDFAGRTIVPTALKNGTPEMQYDSDTSMLSRALGDLINFSPMQIDYIIGDYFGDFGKLFVMATAPGTWSGDRTFLQTTYDILISPWVKDNRYSNYDTGAYYDRLEELDKVVQDKKNHEGKDAAEQSLEYQVQQALKSRYGNDIDALNKQARELPDGPEKDDVKQRLADLIAEAIEYHDRALAGEIDKPILDARYAKCSDRVSNELIRLDSYSETYQFKPIDSAPKKLVDPDDNEREFVFTDEQKDKYLEIYYEFYNEYVDDAMSESWYRNSDGEEQAGLVLDAKKEAATDAKEAFFDWLEKQGVRSTPRKKVYR